MALGLVPREDAPCLVCGCSLRLHRWSAVAGVLPRELGCVSCERPLLFCVHCGGWLRALPLRTCVRCGRVDVRGYPLPPCAVESEEMA